MMDFLIKHKLINHSQHGFLKAKSCLTNLLCFFEEITKLVDEGSPVEITAPIASSCSKNHRKIYYMTRFIATMIMTLTLMSDVDRNRMSVIATPGDF